MMMPIKEEPMEAIKEEPEEDQPMFVVDRGGPEVIEIDDDSDEDDVEKIFVSVDEVAQAFSHFSYILGGRKMVICDLQGVYDRSKKRLQLTDPVIHYHDNETGKGAGSSYGRTDRGAQGITDFLDTHECNPLCDMVTKGFFPTKPAASSPSIDQTQFRAYGSMIN